jgi:hypothetical protein
VPDALTSLVPDRSSPRVECGASVVEADMTRDITLVVTAYIALALLVYGGRRRCHHLLAFDVFMPTMFIVIPYTNEYPMYDFKVDALLCPGVQCP